jgi:hypothetical protein
MATTTLTSTGVTFPDSSAQTTAITTGNYGYRQIYSGTQQCYLGGFYDGNNMIGVEYTWNLTSGGNNVFEALSPASFCVITRVGTGGFSSESTVYNREYGLGFIANGTSGRGLITWPINIYNNYVAQTTKLSYRHGYVCGTNTPAYIPNYLDVRVYVMNDCLIDGCTFVSASAHLRRGYF